MTNIFAVVGQHRVEPTRLLLLGEDGCYYAYNADGRPVAVSLSAAWRLDEEETGETMSTPHPLVVEAPMGARAITPTRLAGSVRLLPYRRGRTLLGLVAGLLLGLLVLTPAALAYAPGLARVLTDLAVLDGPSSDAGVVTNLPAGTTVELTGNAAGDFVEILIDGQSGWANVALLDADGIDTATVDIGAVLQSEPINGSPVLRDIPAGSTVILTGAVVDGYLAASFAGTGGWVAADVIL